jgi:pimeloyl-ACP methyl ester carboxylesterase
MDAAGLTAAHVLGWSEGGPLAILLAVTHPDRVQSLILYGTQATFRRRDDYPFGDEEGEEESKEWYAELEAGWGTVDHVLVTHPDADPRFAQRRALYMQSAASPAAALDTLQPNFALFRPRCSVTAKPTSSISEDRAYARTAVVESD